MRLELVRHVGRQLVGRRLCNAVRDIADVLLAAQDERCTMSPWRAGTIRRAACWLATNAPRTPTAIIASHRHRGCSQNGAGQVNWPSSAIRS